jgi:hypothetical protein
MQVYVMQVYVMQVYVMQVYAGKYRFISKGEQNTDPVRQRTSYVRIYNMR